MFWLLTKYKVFIYTFFLYSLIWYLGLFIQTTINYFAPLTTVPIKIYHVKQIQGQHVIPDLNVMITEKKTAAVFSTCSRCVEIDTKRHKGALDNLNQQLHSPINTLCCKVASNIYICIYIAYLNAVLNKIIIIYYQYYQLSSIVCVWMFCQHLSF